MVKSSSTIWSIILLLISAGSLAGCQATPGTDLLFDGIRAYELSAEQLGFGPRHPGSAGHWQTGDWILQELADQGWRTFEQPFSFDGHPLRNLVGINGPDDASVIILGAHYDTRPVADEDPDNPAEPVPGANDGASGVSVLLELARVLRSEDLCNQVWLVFFDAEDSGNLGDWDWAMGSAHFVEVMEIIPQAVVIVDMVGDADLRVYYEPNSEAALSQEIWAVADQLGHAAFIPTFGRAVLDDHIAFVQRGIPAVDIIDIDYPAWHTTQDTLDQISAESLEQVGRTLEVWVESCP